MFSEPVASAYSNAIKVSTRRVVSATIAPVDLPSAYRLGNKEALAHDDLPSGSVPRVETNS